MTFYEQLTQTLGTITLSDFTLRHGAKWPRQYAQDILKCKTREERLQKLQEVPEGFRDWVRFYVEDAFKRKRGN